MRLSRKAEYGLRALTAMARGKKSWGIQELSVQENIPVKFLEQILLALRHAGFLVSRRGVGGGYSLGKSAGEITVGDIVRTLDGPIAPIPCASERPGEQCNCPHPDTCPVRQVMEKFRNDMAGWLDSYSLEDLGRLAPGANTLAFEI
jgi:Rrf2 family cysteine metabolism transcriptional repressor